MTRFALVAALCLLPAGAFAADDDHSDDDHLVELEGAEILHAWAQASDGPDARVFMEIENDRDTDIILKGGDAHGLAKAVALMGAPLSADGDPVPLEEMPVGAGAHLDLAPDGIYLLLTGLEKPLTKGDEFEMHIELEPFGEVEIHVEVEAANASNHSHAGHNH